MKTIKIGDKVHSKLKVLCAKNNISITAFSEWAISDLIQWYPAIKSGAEYREKYNEIMYPKSLNKSQFYLTNNTKAK